MTDPATLTGPVLFYDGTCGLCNRSVRLLLRLDRHARLRFAPLQSELAQGYLRRHGLPTEDFDSMVLVPAWERREFPEYALRTDAAVAALKACGGFAAGLGKTLGWVPSSWRDGVYRVIARWRYRLWGEWQACPVPKPEWTRRFVG